MRPVKKEPIKKDPNEIINWYEKLQGEITKPAKVDTHFKQYYILPCSMVLSIVGTGNGKTMALMSFLSLKND